MRLVARAEILVDEVGKIGCGLRSGGGHSGFHAINLAVQFGAKRIVLVGFDMSHDRGAHWHQHAAGTLRRKDAKGMVACRDALDGCAVQFVSLGVDVVNTSEKSGLRAYPKCDFMQAVNGCSNLHSTG